MTRYAASPQSNTFDFERKEAQRAALLQQAASARVADAGQVDPDQLTPSQIIAKGEAVQQESQASVARMAKMVASTKQVGGRSCHYSPNPASASRASTTPTDAI